MILIGIDPGTAGGISVYNSVTKETIAVKMPGTDTEIKEFLSQYKGEEVYVLCEKVGGFIGTRKTTINLQCPRCTGLIPYVKETADPASAMFKFGDGNGFIRGVCITLGFGFDTIIPRSWQKVYNLVKWKGMSKTQWKNILKDRAQKLFPQLKVTLNTADALLILNVLMMEKIVQF